jgi:hypothetical protein
MIDLQQYKAKRLEHFNQLILLDRDGKVCQSCNTIFDTAIYLTKPIRQDIPFLDSIFEIIKQDNQHSIELLFSKVQSPFNKLKGVYDFTFSKISVKGKDYILWAIYDFTILYKDLVEYQQRYNELEIRKQLHHSVLGSIKKRRREQSDIKAMVKALNQGEENQEFDLNDSIQSVLNAFSYLENTNFEYFNSLGNKRLYGDITWFKFMLYHLLDHITTAYKTVTIKLNVISNDTLSNTYLNLKLSFLGEIHQPHFFKIIFNNPNIAIDNLSIKEQAFLSKLYSIQKTVHQYHGYLELKPDETYQNLQTTLAFSFHFKHINT